MEPRTPTPEARLDAVRKLADAGVPVGVMMAPVVPGLTDAEIPKLLQAAQKAGACCVHYTMLRLPLAMKPIFLDWLERSYPFKAPRVKAMLQEVRGGELNDPRFGSRMTGEGLYAEQIAKTFELFARKYGMDQGMPPLDESKFRRVRGGMVQGELFPR
jgi:DNA repair photolyase